MVKTKAGSLACLMALSEKLHPITEQNAWHRAAKQRRFVEFRRTEDLGADTVLDSFCMSLQLPFPIHSVST